MLKVRAGRGMLRSFRVANHTSIRDEQQLLLLPAYDKSRTAVPVAAVFGANASGKSNLLDALGWMRQAVLRSYAGWQPESGVPRKPFKLDPAASAQPSGFAIELVLDGVRYSYGFEVDDVRVRHEWLHAYPHQRRRVIFERDVDGVRLGSTLPDHRTRGDILNGLTRPNALFISVAAQNALAEVSAVYQWFRTGLTCGEAGQSDAEAEFSRRLRNGADRQSVVDLVRAADLGIADVTVRVPSDVPLERDLETALLKVLREQQDEINSRLAAATTASGDTTELDRLVALRAEVEANRDRILGIRDQRRAAVAEQQRPSLRFHHGGHRAVLGLDEQSMGTRIWVTLISRALHALDQGGLLAVDEVDASLHPHLTARLINLFRDAETNPRGAQLLFTSHDATLLDEETLSRDEIWFVEKDPDSGATRLYPLTDFHPRKNENTEGRYLAGSYGAVPVVSDSAFRRAVRERREPDEAA